MFEGSYTDRNLDGLNPQNSIFADQFIHKSHKFYNPYSELQSKLAVSMIYNQKTKFPFIDDTYLL